MTDEQASYDEVVTRKPHPCHKCKQEIPKGTRVKFCTTFTFYGRSTGYYYRTKQYYCNTCQPTQAQTTQLVLGNKPPISKSPSVFEGSYISSSGFPNKTSNGGVKVDA